jgi:hypothetical protein
MKLNPKLLEVLACPLTKQPLEYDEEKNILTSKSGMKFDVIDGIPIMLIKDR